MIGRLPHHAVLRFRSTIGENRYRDEQLAHVDPVACRARFDPISSDEDTNNRETGRTYYNIELRPTGTDAGKTAADLRSFDEIDWLEEGLTLKLDGPATPLHDGIGRRHHFEAVAHLVTPAV